MDVGKTRDDSISHFLNEAARFFELGDIVAVEQLSAGLVNLTFLVQTERGEYILKEESDVNESFVTTHAVIAGSFSDREDHTIDIEEDKILEWASSGRIPAIRDGDKWIFEKERVESWVKDAT